MLNGTTKKPLEFATVALLPATGNNPVDGTVADKKGHFALKGLAAGGRIPLATQLYGEEERHQVG